MPDRDVLDVLDAMRDTIEILRHNIDALELYLNDLVAEERAHPELRELLRAVDRLPVPPSNALCKTYTTTVSTKALTAVADARAAYEARLKEVM